MTAAKSAEPGVEQERQELIAELAADQGTDWAEQFRRGSFGCHELLDRTSLLTDAIERQVLTHPACVSNQNWFALADRARSALQELYQRVGAAHLDDGPPGPQKGKELRRARNQ